MRPLYPTAVGVVLLLALAARPAPADSFADSADYDDLVQHVLVRQGTIPDNGTPEDARLFKALDKAATALLRPGRSPAGDLAVLNKVAALLEGAFPGDGEFGADVDGALDDYRADHAALAVRLYSFLDRVPDGDNRQVRGYAGAEKAAALATASDGASDRPGRAKSLAKAVKALDGAWKAALGLKGAEAKNLAPASASTAAATVAGAVLTPDGVIAEYYPPVGFLSVEIKQAEFTAGAPPRRVFLSIRAVDGPGAREITIANIGLNFTYYIPSGIVSEGDGSGGLVNFGTEQSGANTGLLTITTFDLERRIAAGTFYFTAQRYYGLPGTRQVTGGSFRTSFRIKRDPTKVYF